MAFTMQIYEATILVTKQEFEVDEQELLDAQEQRENVRDETEQELTIILNNEAGLDRLSRLSDQDWNEALAQDKAREWQPVVDDMTNVQKLVHLAMRRGADDVEEIRAQLLEARRRSYVDEITILAKRAGCAGQSGRLTRGETLTDFSNDSEEDGESIVNTYNFDMAHAILNIAKDVPTANRATYVSRLTIWEADRAGWKANQIMLNTDGLARQRAILDFRQFNDIDGVAILKPDGAKEEICQGWQKRGEVPLAEAIRNAPPYHISCPHYWETILGKISREECQDLWVGE